MAYHLQLNPKLGDWGYQERLADGTILSTANPVVKVSKTVYDVNVERFTKHHGRIMRIFVPYETGEAPSIVIPGDLSNLDFGELRDLAKSLHVSAGGTRERIEARIRGDEG